VGVFAARSERRARSADWNPLITVKISIRRE
jgi:hypothetical protein